MGTDYRTSDGKIFTDNGSLFEKARAEDHQRFLDSQSSSSSSSPVAATENDRLKVYLHEAYDCLRKNNYDKGIEYCDKALALPYTVRADQGEVYNVRGVCYGNKGNIEQAIADYKEAAKRGDKTSMKNLANLESKPLVDQGATAYNAKDYAKAVELWKKAADMGSANAFNNLGVCYKNGQGVPKDMTKAAEWFEKAANLGHAVAMNGLGYCYLNGNGKPKDQAKAVEWFNKAINAGNASAIDSLGECYRDGTGVKQDFAKAEQLFNEALAKGIKASADNLAKLKQMRGK
jgi:TPR repeat protein